MSQRKVNWPFGNFSFRKSTPRKQFRTRRGPPLAAEVQILEDRTLLSVSLGTAETFAVLGATTVTSTPGTVITGNLGVSPGSAITGSPTVIGGTIHSADAISAQAHADLATAYGVLAGEVLTSDLSGQNLGGLTLAPGVYHFGSSAALGAKLTLDAQGNPNAEWVFQIASTLTTTSNSSVVMINGGNAGSVYWQIGSSATIGTGTAFLGHIVALTSVTVDHGASVVGGALAVNGAVTMDDNAISVADSVSTQYSFPGEYGVTTGNVVTLASITQNAGVLTLVGSSTATATITNATQILVNGTDTAAYGNSSIVFTSGTFAGQVWTKLDLPVNYTNQGGAAVQVIQNGTSLTFVNKLGQTSAGHWISPTQFIATDWGNEIGTIGKGIISWSAGVVWSENLVLTGTNNGSGTTTITALPSPIYVADYVNPGGLAVHLVQTGTNNVVVIDATGHMALGAFINSTQFTTPYFPGQVATISGNGNMISWSGGIVWTQSASTGAITVTNYTNNNGIPVHLIQNGTSQLAFVDALRRTSLGSMLSSTTVQCDLFAGVVGTLSLSSINWSNSIVWTRTNVIPLLITLTDSNGAVSHVQLTSPNTLIGLDGAMQGLTATRVNGELFWSNGAFWANFDMNSVNALFEMGTGYP